MDSIQFKGQDSTPVSTVRLPGLQKDRLQDLIKNKAELLTTFIGDSHTWGQGADGAENALTPPPVLGGEFRRLPPEIPCFASLFSNYLKSKRLDKKGTYAINYGFGCSSSSKYLAVYWEQAVQRYTPDILVMAFAINDWLVDPVSPDIVTLEDFRNNINKMIDKAVALGTIPILLTVSPILGNLYSGGHYYPDYIDATRSIGMSRDDVILADANKIMMDYLENGNRAQREKELFYDDWHVSQIGHDLYCRALIDAIGMKP